MAEQAKQAAGGSAASAKESTWSIVKDILHVPEANMKVMVEDQTISFDSGLKKVAEEAILGKMGKEYFEHLKLFSKAVAYDGFNPMVILKLMAEKAVNYNKTNPSTETFNFTVDGVEFSLSKKANLNEDVAMLCTIFLTRGNNLFKILKTIGKEAKAAIGAKMVTYGIKSDDDMEAAARKRKEKIALSSTDITLSRVAATFPQITLAVAKAHKIEGKAALCAIKECYVLAGGDRADQMPHVLQHGMLASLLSRNEPEDETNLRAFCYMFNLEQSMTLQPQNVKKIMMQEPITGHIESSMRFVQAAISGPMNKDEVRQYLRKGLLEGTDKSEVTAWINAGAAAWIRAQTSPSYLMLVSGLSDQAAKMSMTKLEVSPKSD